MPARKAASLEERDPLSSSIRRRLPFGSSPERCFPSPEVSLGCGNEGGERDSSALRRSEDGPGPATAFS